MKQDKKIQVVLLATNKTYSTNLWLNRDNQTLHLYEMMGLPAKHVSPQHLYFLSDDVIKEGDYAYHNLDGKVIQITKDLLDGDIRRFGYRKVIATTDKSLLALYGNDGDIYGKMRNGLPQPSSEFIQHFIQQYKGNIITEVLVEYELYNTKPNSAPIYGKFEEKLKINSDNTINIKPVENTWDDVKKLYYKDIEGCKSQSTFVDDFINWLKENYKISEKL